MEAKCPKCENTSFSIIKRDDKLFCYVACDECGCVVGILEDIDFNKKYKKIIQNHGFFEGRINELESKLKELEQQNKLITEISELTNNTVNQILKKIK